MFTAVDLAKCLFDYFKERGYSERPVSLRMDPLSVGILGSVLVTFGLCSDGSEVSVLLESGFLDEGYLGFVLNGGVDTFYKMVSDEARADRAKYSGFLRDLSVSLRDGRYEYRFTPAGADAAQLFRAVFNECIRPALHYARTRGDKI